ncbi:MAG: ATP-dependent DNA helicase [Candidatus Paceibacterota bacterium]|jgi:DNA helicase-2/ATP-dependent DNA helicase PcrA
MHDTEFKKRYTQLNAAQREAVDAVEGPVMVVAGPGTGKTQILTLRIANILTKTDTNPENILALTFTEAGTATMRRRLMEIVGAPAYSVTISTFHAFCNGIIKEYPEEFPYIIGSESITEVDQITLLENIVRTTPLTILKPFGDPLYYVRDILKAINDLKREGVDPSQFVTLVEKEQERFDASPDLYHEKGAHKGEMKGDYKKELKIIEKNRELARVYIAYVTSLQENKLYDYSDMIMEVFRALQTNKNLLLILQEQYQYVLVDEHQDTNKAQNNILELLCNFHAQPNIFVVGDEKQAIFRFQGASLENFLYFKKLYPEAKLIFLEENYRSTQTILDSAHRVIPSPKGLHAQPSSENKGVNLFAFTKPIIEQYFLAKSIKAKIDAGVAPGEIAVLYRDNRDVTALLPMVERMGIPFVVESDENVMNDHDIKKIIRLLRAADTFGSDEHIAEAMHIDFLGLHPLDVYRVLHETDIKKCSLYDVLKSDVMMRNLRLEDGVKIRRWYGKLTEWAIAAKNKSLEECASLVINESGFLAYLLGKPDAVEKMEKLNGFFDELQSLVEKHKDTGLHEFLLYLDTIETHNLLIRKSSFGGSLRRVHFMTAHKSKGQEFEHVYIVNAFNGHWGNKKRGNALPLPSSVFSLFGESSLAHDPLDDERRLFYVALTRAKKTVTISYAKESTTGREQLPCQFIEEMKSELVEEINTNEIEKEFEVNKQIIVAPPQLPGARMEDKEFIRSLFLERGISATALNNYLKCPWRYFYQNLLRIPAAKQPHQLYGTAIHAALQDLFNAAKNNKHSRTFLLERFSYHFDAQPFQAREQIEWKERGVRALGGYYDTYHASWRTNILNEVPVRGILLTPEIKLTGKIDKLEIINERNEVQVTDYKTGKPRTRGEIEGSTQNSNGDIKRQLVFYNVLLNRYENHRFTMVSADVDFVEPDEKGRYKRESFVISPKEVEELEGLIKKTAEDICTLSFWDTRCDDATCQFCALRGMME